MLLYLLVITTVVIFILWIINTVSNKFLGRGMVDELSLPTNTSWRYVSLLIVFLVILGNFMYQIGQPTNPRCGTAEFRASYVSDWDDEYGPCTYIQKVTDSLVYWLLYPLVLGSVLFMVGITLTMSAGIRNKWSKKTWLFNITSTVAMIYIVIWLIFGSILGMQLIGR
jgi:hypothetical protein